MSYDTALTAAGATVHRFEMYGGYLGNWMAHVTLPDGRTGFILDYYGSCSGCDAYQAELEYNSHKGDSGEYHSDGEKADTCKRCAAIRDKIAKFGATYFDQLLTVEEALAKCAEWTDSWNSSEYREMAGHIRECVPHPGGQDAD